MKKLLPLILLAACADPNAELLAKYKNLEIDNQFLKDQMNRTREGFNRTSEYYTLQINQCKEDLKYYVCQNKKRKDIEYRMLCEDAIIVDLPGKDEE